ncbi:MAG: M42 family peptidase, partial [Methanobrevibacter sp.]|nr:M42 family peptidase [Methanobrevibacter sp.]
MELMRELSLAPGVSGSEEEIAKIITRELKDVADKIETDSMGNLIATKKGQKKAPTVMLAAHMDEIGLMVRYIDDNGFINFSTIGGINDQMLMNQTVTIHSSIGEPVVGVIGSKPPHVTTPEERNKVVKAKDMFIDIGAKDKEEAEKMVRVGDKMTFNALFEEYPNKRIMGKALDNRVGCYVMMEVLKRVDTRATVYGVG